MVTVRMDPRVRGRIDPSDVIQETLALSSQRLSQYMTKRPIPLYPWLRLIAWEKLVQEHNRHLRAAKRSLTRERQQSMHVSDASVADLAKLILGNQSNPSAHALQEELRVRLRQALDALPETDREVLVLRYLEQMPCKEIASLINSTEAAINMRQMRSLERLRKVLNATL